MLISHDHRFAFVHVPKTGGCSVRTALGRFATRTDRYWANRWLARCGIHVNHYAPPMLRRFRPHASAATLRRHLPADLFAGLFKFAFVRNPWDLLVSYYGYLRHAPNHHRRRIAARLSSFASYVEYEIRRGKISQSRMLTDRQGRLLVDFVGRFESLDHDFRTACRRIGVEATLGHVNVGRRGDYRDYYDDRLADLVARHFAEDIDRFGYRFDGDARAAAGPGRRRAA